MLLEAIYHRPGNSYCYSYDNDTIHIRLRAKKGDLRSVTALYGDKYDWDKTVREAAMFIMGSDELFDYWHVEVAPPHKRLRYAFELAAGEQILWYTEKGFVTEKPADPLTFFDYPFLWSSEVLQPPAWVKDAVFYQIFPDRFANGNPDNDPEQVRPWTADDPGQDDFYGGDLQGVLDRLDYISELGVNAIYFTPLFEAKTNHKYDTTDYLKVDPQFGDVALLKKLVKACHDRGDSRYLGCGIQSLRLLVRPVPGRYEAWGSITLSGLVPYRAISTRSGAESILPLLRLRISHAETEYGQSRSQSLPA